MDEDFAAIYRRLMEPHFIKIGGTRSVQTGAFNDEIKTYLFINVGSKVFRFVAISSFWLTNSLQWFESNYFKTILFKLLKNVILIRKNPSTEQRYLDIAIQFACYWSSMMSSKQKLLLQLAPRPLST